MPIPAQIPEISYTADGIATSYAYPFRSFAASDLVVTVAGFAKVLDIEYTVTGIGATGGGSVVFMTPPVASSSVQILREIPLDRSTNYTAAGPNSADTLDDDLDRIVATLQDRSSLLSRSLRFPLGDTTNPTLPVLESRKNTLAGYGPDGEPTANAMTFTTFAGGDVSVGSIAALRALPIPVSGSEATILQGRDTPGDGGGGVFIWDGSDLSAKVAADPLGIKYVAPNVDPTGASGARVLSPSTPESVAMVDGFRREIWPTLAAYLKNASNYSRLFHTIKANQNDVYVLTQGDSTGDSDYEFFRVMADAVAALFPTHTVLYKKWNHPSTLWDSATTISTGTGPRTITFYNGSYAGATPSYWTGKRNGSAYDGKFFDTIITNYGLNVPTLERHQTERLAEYLYTLGQQQPQAEVLVTIQATDYDLLDRTANRVKAQRRVAGLYGCRIIDVYSLFLELVKSTGGVYTSWYIDQLHPSVAGALEWAGLALSTLLTGGGGAIGAALPALAPSQLPNGNFREFLAGTSSPPTFWETSTSCVRDTSLFETSGNSARCVGVGAGTGVMYIPADEIFSRYKHAGDLLVAARVYSIGASTKVGTLYAAHSVSTAYTEIQNTAGQASESSGGWRWAFLLIPKSFYNGKTDTHIGVFSGEAGELVSVDRIVIAPSLIPSDSDLTCSWRYRFDLFDSGFSLPAGAQSLRVFLSVPANSIKAGVRLTVGHSAIPDSVILSGARVTAAGTGVLIQYYNPSAGVISIPDVTYRVESGQ